MLLRAAPLALAIGLALAALLATPTAPAAGTDYTCRSAMLVMSCAGVDPKPECHRPSDRSDWGVDTFTFGGHAAGLGGTWWCGTQDNETRSGRWMDAGYHGRDAKAFVKSEQDDAAPDACRTTLHVETALREEAPSAPCATRPFHARDVLLP